MPTGRRVSKRAACGSVFGNPDDASGPGRAQGCLRAVSDTGFEVEHGLATRRKLAIDLLESVVTACSEHQGGASLRPQPGGEPDAAGGNGDDNDPLVDGIEPDFRVASLLDAGGLIREGPNP